jgi:PrcB C-terminal
MNVIQPVLLGLTAMLLVGCASNAWAEPLPIRTLVKGAFSGIQEPKQEVIRDKATWEKTWAKHSASSKSAGKMPEVDFSKEMVIFVTMGRKNTGGYSIQVTKVEPMGDKLRITVSRTAPPAGAMTIQALTAPFQIVAVPKSDLSPKFVETENKK